MKRRSFLKAIATIPFIGVVIGKSTPKPVELDETIADLGDSCETSYFLTEDGIINSLNSLPTYDQPIDIALCDIQKDKWGWVKVGSVIRGPIPIWRAT